MIPIILGAISLELMKIVGNVDKSKKREAVGCVDGFVSERFISPQKTMIGETKSSLYSFSIFTTIHTAFRSVN